jgi:hypothetical protein
MPSPTPHLQDDELAALQLLTIRELAAQHREAPAVAEPFARDPKKALVQAKDIEQQEAQVYRGHLNELAELLRHNPPDILGEISQLQQRPSFWGRVKRTLGLT